MYKVVKKTNGNLTSNGKTFEFGKSIEVTKQVFEYLKNTFPNDFEFDEVKEKVDKKPKTTRKSKKTKEEVVLK